MNALNLLISRIRLDFKFNFRKLNFEFIAQNVADTDSCCARCVMVVKRNSIISPI